MKNPLRKRIPRELKGEFGKYLVVFLLMVLTIGFVSGFLVADGSMLKAYNESFDKYNIENGNFRTAEKIYSSQWKDIEAAGVKLYENYYIEEDLDNAIKCNLPVERSTAKERITKGAAIAMLGKVYATQHKYPEAKQLLGTLLKAPYSYELMDNFEKNFTNEEEFNKESVFELAYSPDGDYSWSNESGICLGCYIPQFIGPVKSGGWAKLMPNSLIVGEFTKETRPSDADTKFDKRMYASLFFDAANYGDKVPNEKWYGNNYSMDDLWEGNEGKMAGGAPSFNVNGTAGKFLIKKNTAYYVDDKAPDNMGNKEGRSSNLRVMRFAEVLLLYAEACAKTNDPDGANYALKQIRQRAGLTEKTFAQAELMNEIEHQCLLEFFAEGHRFDDLKRWYSPSEIQLIFKANGKQGAENFQEKHLYYPIPTSELNNNTAMEQTSLWK